MGLLCLELSGAGWGTDNGPLSLGAGVEQDDRPQAQAGMRGQIFPLASSP